MYVCTYVYVYENIFIYMYIHVYTYIYIIYMCIRERALLLFCIAVLRRFIAAASSNCGKFITRCIVGVIILCIRMFIVARCIALLRLHRRPPRRPRRRGRGGPRPSAAARASSARPPVRARIRGYSHVLQEYSTGTARVLRGHCRGTIADYSRL
jgi:hypothetical protein